MSELLDMAFTKFKGEEDYRVIDCCLEKEEGIEAQTTVEVEMLEREGYGTIDHPLTFKIPPGEGYEICDRLWETQHMG